VICAGGRRPLEKRFTYPSIEQVGSKDAANLKSMEQKRNARFLTINPVGKELDVVAPILKGHLQECSCAFTDTSVIEAENFNPPRRQVTRPTHPWVIGFMSFCS
jgi:hypothetical protein